MATRRAVLEALACGSLVRWSFASRRAVAADPGATVRHVGAVDPGILGITIDVGRTRPSTLEPYLRHDDDEVEIPAENGRLANGDLRVVYLRRDGKRVGWLVGAGNDHVTWFEKLESATPNETLAALPASWSIGSDDDPAYRQPLPPVRVWRKRKPTDWVRSDTVLRTAPMRQTFYLALPSPLVDGATYAIDIEPATELFTDTLRHTHDPIVARSEAVHAIHTGYRPDDPGKRAYLSVWLGDGGGHRFPDGLTFQVIEADSGRVAHTGWVQRAWPAEAIEEMGRRVNHNDTDVGYLDFAELTAPGIYRVVVEGVGCSHPFTIGDDGWLTAFRTSMLGFLHQRAGIELGPPLTDYMRPLNLHPSMTTIWQSTLQPGRGDLQALAQARTEDRVDAFGGYQDAGDFDSRSGHLLASRLHMTLLELSPRLAGLELRVPEAGNGIPDLLDEALWNVMLYRRLQRHDGAVANGIEASAHPRLGEPSWMTSLTLLAYAPDALASYRHAATAAQAARLLRDRDAAWAEDLEESARRAFAWAEGQPRAADDGGARATNAAARNLAACALYWSTGEPAFHTVFRATTRFAERRESTDEGANRQGEAAFCYARMTSGVVDPTIQANCRAAILATAEVEALGAAGNAFDITHPVASMPLILGRFSAPQAIHSCWAHWLTGERRFLETAVRSSHFGLGANPMNMTLTTGLGHESAEHPLHLDSRNSGQPAPAGLTVYGNNDYRRESDLRGWLGWPFLWFFDTQCYPPGDRWPITESYFDVFGVPSMNEFTIEQTMAPASFVWGYLAGRS